MSGSGVEADPLSLAVWCRRCKAAIAQRCRGALGQVPTHMVRKRDGIAAALAARDVFGGAR